MILIRGILFKIMRLLDLSLAVVVVDLNRLFLSTDVANASSCRALVIFSTAAVRGSDSKVRVDKYMNVLFQIYKNIFNYCEEGNDKQLVTMGSLPETMINCDALFLSENRGRQVTVIKNRFVENKSSKRRSRHSNV